RWRPSCALPGGPSPPTWPTSSGSSAFTSGASSAASPFERPSSDPPRRLDGCDVRPTGLLRTFAGPSGASCARVAATHGCRDGPPARQEVTVRLATRITGALVLGILAVMGAYTYIQVSNEVVLYKADIERARRNGLAWLGAIESVWGYEGEERAREVIAISARRAAAPESRLRLLSLAAGAPDRPELLPDELRSLEAGGIVTRIRRHADGQQWREAYAAIRTAERPTVLEVMEPLRGEDVYIHMSHFRILEATIAIVATCGLLATLLHMRLVGRPLGLLRDKARRAGNGDFSGPLALRQRDEMGELATEINAMCDRLAEANRRAAAEAEARVAALEQLRHTERLALVGQLAAGVAHELGTPLGVISARAQPIAARGGTPLRGTKSGPIILDP